MHEMAAACCFSLSRITAWISNKSLALISPGQKKKDGIG
jgi:hypothetical protein